MCHRVHLRPLRRLHWDAWVLSVTFIGAASVAAEPPSFNSPALPHVTSWLGNTYPGEKKWVQQNISAMAVMADGTVFTNVGWEEGGGNVGEYRDGELIRYARHTHGWGASGGISVAANSTHVFIGMGMNSEGGSLKDAATWPPKGTRWFGISRRLRSDISKAAPFPGGKGGKGDTLKEAFLIVAEKPDKEGASLAGLVATESEVFVSEPNTGEIQVFDCATMKLTRRWKVERAGPLAMNRQGNMAMLQKGSGDLPARVLYFGKAEVPSMQVTFPPDMIPSAICFHENRLLVADIGPAQQILVFTPLPDEAKLRFDGRYGKAGGISGNKGVPADLCFNRLQAIGCDAKGNLYVAHGGGTVLESYVLANGKRNWQLHGLTFVDMADVDPGSDEDVFTKEEHLKFDYSQPTGREWRYAGYTLNRFQFPQDPRLHLQGAGAWVRRIGGKRLLFVNDMNGVHLQVFRFADGGADETAIPSGLFGRRRKEDGKQSGDAPWPPNRPDQEEWIWRDANGNGAVDSSEFDANTSKQAGPGQSWWVDAHGNVWMATGKGGLRLFPQEGLDAAQNPTWSYSKMKSFAVPEDLTTVNRLRYLPEGDTMFLAGTREEHKNQHWKPSGPAIACYDGWLNGKRRLRWSIVAPYALGAKGHSSCEPMGFDVAGDYVFVPYTGESKTAGVKRGRVEIFRATDGGGVGHIEPGEEVGLIGLQDIRECLTAHRRADGEYIVFLEDDSKAKVVVYRLKLPP